VYVEENVDAAFSEFSASFQESAPLSTPEPSTALLLDSALAGLGMVSRRLRRR